MNFLRFLGGERSPKPHETSQRLDTINNKEHNDREERMNNLINPFNTKIEAINRYLEEKNIGNSGVWKQQIDKIHVLKQELTTWLAANDRTTKENERKITAIQDKLSEIKDILKQIENSTDATITSITAAIGIMAIEMKEIKKEQEKHGYNIYDILSQRHTLSIHDRAILETILMFYEAEGGNDNATRWRIKRYKEKSGTGKEGAYDLSSPPISSTIVELLKPTGLLDEPSEPVPTSPPFSTKQPPKKIPARPPSKEQAMADAAKTTSQIPANIESPTPSEKEEAPSIPIKPKKVTINPDIVLLQVQSDEELWGEGSFPKDNSWIPKTTPPPELTTPELTTPEPATPEPATPEITESEQQETENVFALNTTPLRLINPDTHVEGIYTDTNNDVRKTLKNAKIVALGDAHGSALKILESGVLAGFISMPSDTAKNIKSLYTALIEKQISPFATEEEEKKSFTDIQNQIIELLQTITWTGENRTFLLIGDTISDRGISDAITIALIEKIRTLGGNIQILASNHDADILFKACKDIKNTYKDLDITHCGDLFQCISYYRAIQAGLEEQKIHEYIRSQQLFYYDKKNNTFFTHAPVTKEDITVLQNRLNIEQITTPGNIQDFVQKANEWYQNIVKNVFLAKTKFTKDMQKEEKQKLRNILPPKADITLLNTLVWRRRHGYPNEKNIPFYGIVKNIVHGHTPDTETSPLNRFNVSIDTSTKEKIYTPNNSNLPTNVTCLDHPHRKTNYNPENELDNKNNAMPLFVS